MADNKYFQAEPLVQDVAKALAVGRTPYTLTFFEQINSPQGPWLQMLQRAYYTDDDLDTVIADAKAAMKAISCDVVTDVAPGSRSTAAALAEQRRGDLASTGVGSTGGRQPRPGDAHVRNTAQQADRAPVPAAGAAVRAGRSPPTRSSRWSGCRSTTGR